MQPRLKLPCCLPKLPAYVRARTYTYIHMYINCIWVYWAPLAIVLADLIRRAYLVLFLRSPGVQGMRYKDTRTCVGAMFSRCENPDRLRCHCPRVRMAKDPLCRGSCSDSGATGQPVATHKRRVSLYLHMSLLARQSALLLCLFLRKN